MDAVIIAVGCGEVFGHWALTVHIWLVAPARPPYRRGGSPGLCRTWFLASCRATQGKTATPSSRITADTLRPCALRALPHPATEVLLCRTEAMTGSR